MATLHRDPSFHEHMANLLERAAQALREGKVEAMSLDFQKDGLYSPIGEMVEVIYKYDIRFEMLQPLERETRYAEAERQREIEGA